jgi:hypothetical protein
MDSGEIIRQDRLIGAEGRHLGESLFNNHFVMNRGGKIVDKMALTIFRVRWTFAGTLKSGD